MDNQGNKAENVMQLIMDLEGKCRDLTDQRDRAVHKYWLSFVKRNGFWWGYGFALVSVFVVGLLIKVIVK